MIALIWAQARDATGRPVIGASGGIPWRVPEDFAHFKMLTLGHPVIMGVRTWASLPIKPLPGRTNIVLCRDGEVNPDAGAIVVPALAEALAVAEAAPGGELTWIIGGGQVYQQTIEIADRLVITEVDLIVEGDAYAPQLDPNRWQLTEQSSWQRSKTGLRYRFSSFQRD